MYTELLRLDRRPLNRPAHGAKPSHEDEQSVAAQEPRHDGNSFMVNEGAPDLFPVMSLVKEWFTRREARERRAFDLTAK